VNGLDSGDPTRGSDDGPGDGVRACRAGARTVKEPDVACASNWSHRLERDADLVRIALERAALGRWRIEQRLDQDACGLVVADGPEEKKVGGVFRPRRAAAQEVPGHRWSLPAEGLARLCACRIEPGPILAGGTLGAVGQLPVRSIRRDSVRLLGREILRRGHRGARSQAQHKRRRIPRRAGHHGHRLSFSYRAVFSSSPVTLRLLSCCVVLYMTI
jgi:hypothetical protein